MRVNLKGALIAVVPLVLAAGFAGASAGPAAAFKLGVAVGGQTCCDWQKAQGDVAEAMAKQKGWDFVELSNNGDAATAVKDADIFIQD